MDGFCVNELTKRMNKMKQNEISRITALIAFIQLNLKNFLNTEAFEVSNK
jgi:predicted component of type VI protein secretion system